MHTFVTGETGGGKSFGQITRLLKCLRVIVLDWHVRSIAWELAKQLGSMDRRFVLDNLSWTKHGIAWCILKPSRRDGMTGRKQNEARARAFSEILMRYQGRTNLANTPLVETATMAALLCFLYQSKPFPLYMLYRIFDPGDPLHEYAVEHCTDSEIQRLVARWKHLSQSARRYEIGAAERMFRIVLTSPAFMYRCDGTFDVAKFLDHEDGGHILIEGGDASDESKRVIYGAISQQVIETAKRGKFDDPVQLVLDEAQEYAGQYECKALRETRKFNLDLTVIAQSLPQEMREDVLQNCQRLEVYRCNSPDSARLFGGMIGAVMGGIGSVSSEVSEAQRAIMNLRMRERFVRQGRAWKEHAPLIKDPCPWPGLTEKRTWEAIRRSIGEHGARLSLRGFETTPAPLTKSVKPSNSSTQNSPSPAIKLLRGLSRDSNGNGKSE